MADILAQLSHARLHNVLSGRPLHRQRLGRSWAVVTTRSPPTRLYPRWADFFRPNDVIVTDTGTSSLGLTFAQLPNGAEFHNQTLWASIGWATPAAFGAAIGAPDRRLILITGEGSHQMTAQEISQFGRRGLRPIVFVLNNSGYLSERMLCKDMTLAYNDIAAWNYAELPHAVGCQGWFNARVTHLRRARRRTQDSRASRWRRLHRSRHRCLRGPTAVQKAARERQIVLQRPIAERPQAVAGTHVYSTLRS